MEPGLVALCGLRDPTDGRLRAAALSRSSWSFSGRLTGS